MRPTRKFAVMEKLALVFSDLQDMRYFYGLAKTILRGDKIGQVDLVRVVIA